MNVLCGQIERNGSEHMKNLIKRIITRLTKRSRERAWLAAYEYMVLTEGTCPLEVLG